MATSFQYTRLNEGRKERTTELHELFGASRVAGETWLFVSPHDDDIALGAGLLLQAAVAAGVNVQVLVVTDGAQGYCTLEQREDIVKIRLAETLHSFEMLGVAQPHVHYLGYPDSGLFTYRGRRRAVGTESSIGGYTGLQNAFTWYLRHFRPQRVFVPTSADLHPDHQITNVELMISLFHAGGSIWPELGQPLTSTPAVYELPVYCDFPQPPNIEVRGDAAALQKKLDAVAAYESQLQIAAMVDSIRQAGPFEYLREVQFRLYDPRTYRGMFA